MKRREKQREKDARKAEKAAAAPSKPAKADAVNEDDLNPNVRLPVFPSRVSYEVFPQQYFELRSRQIRKLKETHNPDPYPHKFEVTTSITEYIDLYSPEGVIKPGEKAEGVTECLAGRIHNIRASGQSLRFYDLHGEGKRVQIMATKQ